MIEYTKIEIIRTPRELSDIEVNSIFKSAFSDVPEFALLLISQRGTDAKGEYTHICCNQTGYSIKIWNNYDIQLESSVHPITSTPFLAITKSLIKSGAIKIVDNLK